METPKLEIKPFIDLALRRKWWIIIPAVLSIIGGSVFLAVCPKTYKASTLILLEPQSIPDSFVRSTVTETMEGRLRTITQQIQSRTNLERVIKEFHLWKDEKRDPKSGWLNRVLARAPWLAADGSAPKAIQDNERLATMHLVDELRKSLTVTMRSGGGGGGGGREQSVAFEVSFEWSDPEIMAPITNAIASRFIEENLTAREELAIGTTDFFDKETSTIREELEAREKELEAFRKQNMGMLPDQLQANINILNQLRDESTNLERRLDQEKQQAMQVKSQAQLARTERESLAAAIRQQDQGRTAGGGRRDNQMTAEQLTSGSLEDLEVELRRLSSLYTEKHPDVVALKRRIEMLQSESTGRGGSGAPPTPRDNTDARVNLQLAPINANIDSLKKQIAEVEKQIQVYMERVERTPRVEMELNKISRDYQTVRQRYDNLLARKLDARLAEQMERKKKGEQFRVLDPAVKPATPFKPDIKKVVLMMIVGGLGLGCGLAYLKEMLDGRFYLPEDAESSLDVEVIVSLPLFQVEGQK